MTPKQNFFVTLALMFGCCLLAIFIPNIGQAMTLVGCTINPIIGFILPIIFYWTYIKEKPWYHKEKVILIAVFIIIIVASVLSLIQFFEDLGKK